MRQIAPFALALPGPGQHETALSGTRAEGRA